MTFKTKMTRSQGFTLIEVMIVTAIVAVLAAIAYPAYTSYVIKGERAQARATLLEAAQFMERQYSASNAYSSGGLPVRLRTAPPGSPSPSVSYQISVTASTPTAYTLTAFPIRRDPTCGSLVLTHTGARSHTGSATNSSSCWK